MGNFGIQTFNNINDIISIMFILIINKILMNIFNIYIWHSIIIVKSKIEILQIIIDNNIKLSKITFELIRFQIIQTLRC